MRPSITARLMMLVMIAAAALPHSAAAHDPGLSQSSWHVVDDLLHVEIGMAPAELALLSETADSNGDLQLDATEFAAARSALAETLSSTTEVWNEVEACQPLNARLEWIDAKSVQFAQSFRCVGASTVAARLGWMQHLGENHRHWANIANDSGDQRVLLRADSDASLSFAPHSALSQTLAVAWSGAEHILFGLDHLAFLCGLLLAGGRLRGQVLVLTGFSLAHSITLGLMVSGQLAAPSELIEPLIGLSVLAIAAANFGKWSAGHVLRWALVLGFGLIHGFGFAGAVADQAPASQNLLPWLVAFNVGVELGQLLFVLASFALVQQLGLATPSTGRNWATGVANSGLLLLGSYWIVERVLT